MESFPLQYSNIEESAELLPQPLEGIINLINETVKSFFQQHNYGNTSTKGLMMYCRPSVEKYIFSHLYERLYAMYKCKNEKLDKTYHRGKSMVNDLDSVKQFSTLKIPKEFIFTNEEEEKNIKPYDNCVQILNRIEKSISPGEKVKDIMRMYAEMKIDAIDYSKGKAELQSVDEQSKVLAYIVLKADLSCPNAQFNLLRDYLSLQETSNSTEELVMMNLLVFLLIDRT